MTPKEFLSHLLEGKAIASDELLRFLKDNPEEGQYLDYKNGVIATAQKREEGNQTIREYVSGFANSDGGLLIIGVDESRPRQVAPCESNVGGQALDQWASRCLHDMVGYFSPQPRFQVVNHSKGTILVIAVERAPSLVPCVQSRQLKYFFRIGDSTLEIPDYLIADLVLGRRQHSMLDVHSPLMTDLGIQGFKSKIGQDTIQGRGASLSFTIENLALASAEDIQVGIVSWSLVDGEAKEINRHLAAYLDVCEIGSPSGTASELHLVQRSSISHGKTLQLAPFQKLTVKDMGPIYLPRQVPANVRIAVYVLAKNTPPIWFQVGFGLLYGGIKTETILEDFKPTIARTGNERPLVEWKPG